MLKLLVSGATALMSLGAVSGFLGQEAAPAQEVPKPVEVQVDLEDLKDLKVVSVDDDPAEPIRSAYVILRQLRSERLEDRPRELTDRATELYRAAVKLHGQGNLVVARRYGTAALNAARAVELARIARQGDDQDDDLPPPPPVQVKILKGDNVIELEKLEELHLDLPPSLDGDDDEADDEAGKQEPDRVDIIGLPNGKAEVRVYIQKKEGEEAEAPKGKAEAKVRLRAVPNPEEGSHTIQIQPKIYVRSLPGQEGEAGERKRSFRVEIPGGRAKANVLLRKLGGPISADNVAVWHLPDGPAQARIELKSAYDQIKAARESAGDDEGAKVYLDAAKDLYNAARRDAQAGRNARAAELARAARSLARVPELLKKIEEGGDDEAEAGGRDEEARVLVVPEADQGKNVVRVRPRIEIRKRVRTPDGKESEEVEVREIGPSQIARLVPQGDDQAQDDEDDAGPLVGIGVALEVEDGSYIVRDVLPDSPAAEEGKLKKGDRLVGVKKDNETVEFEGKELIEVVKLIRGKAGTEVRLVVRPEGADDDKVVTLTRRELKLPEPEAARIPGVEVLPRPASPETVGEIPPALDD